MGDSNAAADRAAAAVRRMGERVGELVAVAHTGDMPSLVAAVQDTPADERDALLVTAIHLIAQRDEPTGTPLSVVRFDA